MINLSYDKMIYDKMSYDKMTYDWLTVKQLTIADIHGEIHICVIIAQMIATRIDMPYTTATKRTL